MLAKITVDDTPATTTLVNFSARPKRYVLTHRHLHHPAGERKFFQAAPASSRSDVARLFPYQMNIDPECHYLYFVGACATYSSTQDAAPPTRQNRVENRMLVNK